MRATVNAVDVPAGMAAGDLVYRSSPVQRFIRAEGSYLFDEAGKPYLDAEAANGSVSLGYDRSIVADAASLAMTLPGLPSFCESDLRINVVQRLAARFDHATGRSGRVALELGGAQGVEMALRIVAANRGDGPIFAFQGGYHGRSPFVAHLSASARYRATQPWPGPPVIRLPSPDCESCPHGTGVGCNPACAEYIERLGTDDIYGVPGPAATRGVAALILEPLLNVGGCVLPDSGLVRRVVNHVRSLGGLIIVDEVFTGMHRLGPQWGFQLHDIEPDIIVASKALTNGITPLSAVWAREPLADPAVFPPGSHSSTFAGNPHALAVASVVQDRWERWPDAERSVGELSRHLASSIAEALTGRPIVVRFAVYGAVAKLTLAGPFAARVRQLAVRRDAPVGLLVASTGMAPSTIVLHPPLVSTPRELTEMVGLLERAIGLLEEEV